MKKVGISLRVDSYDYRSGVEHRDGCDQRWFDFFIACDLIPILLPNNLSCVKTIIKEVRLDGILLTGGNSPVIYGGKAPERDEVDNFLINTALQSNLALLGICRGMQSIQVFFQQELHPVNNQVKSAIKISVNKEYRQVNSYHNLGTCLVNEPLDCWAIGEDGVVKAISHNSKNIHGIMWHPERYSSYDQSDIDLFKKVFES